MSRLEINKPVNVKIEHININDYDHNITKHTKWDDTMTKQQALTYPHSSGAFQKMDNIFIPTVNGWWVANSFGNFVMILNIIELNALIDV